MNLQIKLKKGKYLSYWEILLIIQIQKIIMNIYILNLVNDYKKIENKSINEKNLGHLMMTAPSLLDLHDIELRILTKDC